MAAIEPSKEQREWANKIIGSVEYDAAINSEDAIEFVAQALAEREASQRERLEAVAAECDERWKAFGGDGDTTKNELALIAAAYAWCEMEIRAALQTKEDGTR